jgi:hypothetical protein
MMKATVIIPVLGRVNVDGEKGIFHFEYAEEYGPPDLSYAILRAWVDHFGTEEIDTSNTINESGCETCDYGSKYGFNVYIHNATRNNPFH